MKYGVEYGSWIILDQVLRETTKALENAKAAARPQVASSTKRLRTSDHSQIVRSRWHRATVDAGDGVAGIESDGDEAGWIG